MKKVSFARIHPAIELPQLLEMQTRSYEEFLQKDASPSERKIQGLQAAFMDVFPITSTDEVLSLEFMHYTLGEPRYTVEEALAKDANYSSQLRAWLRLVQKQPGGKPKVLTEQEVYFCDLPLMTTPATFVINGVERVVVSQLHRSPGVIFEEDEEKKISSYGKKLYFARLIPYRGAWVEFEFDLNNAIFVRIDKKRKLPATTLLRAMGVETDAEILSLFYDVEALNLASAQSEDVVGKIVAKDVVDTSSGEIVLEANKEITREVFLRLQDKKVRSVDVLKSDPQVNDVAIRNTLLKDNIKTRKEAIQAIYRVVRAQEFIVPEQAESYLENMLFKSIRKYDLTKVGRFKINRKLMPFLESLAERKDFKFEVPNDRRRTLCREDVIATLQYLILLNNEATTHTFGKTTVKVEIDDIDHLGNRRIRSVGELMENQIRAAIAQMARLVRERMNVQENVQITPRTLVNASAVVAAVRRFFGSSQLSQFMDQTNPLAEMTHKRRLSALGPGGLNRKRAGFEVRDVHHTHYGRLCPIETPEGPNIGLITSLACYARINQYGLIETPYRKVEKGRVTNEIDYLTADKEDNYVIAQANAPVDKNGKFTSELIACRHKGDFPQKAPDDIDYMDISPVQVVSTSAALIPFLEHDDANRALMGSNMQRQAVPLLFPERPLVGTGIEGRVARDSAAVEVARRGGVVVSAASDHVAVWSDEGKPGVDLYNLRKYARSNQDTCLNQLPCVKQFEKVSKGDVLADGPSTQEGELALGRNLLVAFMPWEGYNYEDAIILSERLVRDDVFTSIHISEFQVEARDTKMGAEEITKDIPNVGAESLAHLDDTGIIRVGAEVAPGDILVGKVAPKGDQQTTPEERLLKVIFGKKAEDVMDASLRVPPGVTGKILATKVFVRKEKMAKKDENKKMKEIDLALEEKLEILRADRKAQYADIDDRLAGGKISKAQAKEMKEMFEALADRRIDEAKRLAAREKENFKMGDELPVTVNRIVKVYIASKRKIQVGDKLAGRHGNKGVVAKIVPPEDMPYMPDGTPIDVVLSPLGVPSRMNVGQLLECMLGWAAHVMGVETVTPVFDGAKEEQIHDLMRQAKDKLRAKGYPEKYLPSDDGRIQLFDGRTGDAFASKVTVGYMYILKLAHLVEDKIHARSTGPYSLITRQPLGGKAQFGGQRFGEMEVWAIEGYGASHTLQEFLTVKSDDVQGRTKMYEAIIRGEVATEPGVPESFRVLVRELQSLGMNVELVKTDGAKDGGETAKKSAAKEAVAKE
ncbi:MAG TPA: DNA-directed RNA polymerase subunit beta [Elusimicrobiota bacterium]|nr:DNA-directed RNA polymerase subunit beta [Elusimicrobiota bacterium]HMU95207.1 DNA-directed RNA polymerase subunit beta [Elusimicrobiota bacterium]HNG44182.1 DNA-directed RNA polymerase subunit beta [Elusimicrobiota bacterium]